MSENMFSGADFSEFFRPFLWLLVIVAVAAALAGAGVVGIVWWLS